MPKAKSRTHFEQVPLEKIAKVRNQKLPAKKGIARISSIIEAPPAKTQPYSIRTEI